jgi:hypothetical protein
MGSTVTVRFLALARLHPSAHGGDRYHKRRLAKLEIVDVNVPLPFIGPQGTFLGLAQINAGPLPRSLAGRGEVEVRFTEVFDFANVVKLNFK